MTTVADGTKAAFAAEYDVPIPYMQRTRDYYLALGYENPYRWASFTEVPFASLAKPLARARIGLITTAAPYRPEAGDQGPGAPYNAAAKFYQVYSVTTDEVPDLRISHVGYDRKHTSAAASMALLPIAAIAPPSPTRPTFSAAAARTRSTPSSSCPADPSVTRP